MLIIIDFIENNWEMYVKYVMSFEDLNYEDAVERAEEDLAELKEAQ